MYAAYVKEKEGLETLANDVGFAYYKVSSIAKIFDVSDFYIKPEFRNGLKSVKLFNELVKLAKEKGCDKITCCVVTYHQNPEASMYAVLRVGYKISHINDGIIYFYKNI